MSKKSVTFARFFMKKLYNIPKIEVLTLELAFPIALATSKGTSVGRAPERRTPAF